MMASITQPSRKDSCSATEIPKSAKKLPSMGPFSLRYRNCKKRTGRFTMAVSRRHRPLSPQAWESFPSRLRKYTMALPWPQRRQAAAKPRRSFATQLVS